MKNAFDIVRNFEKAVCDYTGANFGIAVNSCTNALFLCLKHFRPEFPAHTTAIHIPKKTYVSVPMQAKHAGYEVIFDEVEWKGAYKLKPLPIWDSARRFTSGMCLKLYDDECDVGMFPGQYFVCVSFHWSKILGVQQGGMILTNNGYSAEWFRKARFDGRTEGIAPKDDTFKELGWHMYLSPEIAAEGLVRLMHLPKDNPDLPNDAYPDLSQFDIFK